MRLGVFGGTFDPPHLGHLVLADRAREDLGLERLLWVSAGSPWRKAGRTVSPSGDRVAMVRLAIGEHDGFELSTLEVERHGPSYSVETLETLRGEQPDARLFFIIGLDTLRDLPNWREPQRLLELATPAVAARGGEQLTRAELEALSPGLADRAAWIDMPRLDISGTELRRRAAEGRTLRYLVPDAVERYIREHGLYQSGA